MKEPSYITYLLQPAMTGIKQVLELMQTSLNALELQTSYSTQMLFIDETKDLSPLKDVRKQNHKASFHRMNAIGSLYRLVDGDLGHQVIGIILKSMMDARKADQAMIDAFTDITNEVDHPAAKQWIEKAEYWLIIELETLDEAILLMKRMFAEDIWQYASGLKY